MRLRFIKDGLRRCYVFRLGLFEIPQRDFELIKRATGAQTRDIAHPGPEATHSNVEDARTSTLSRKPPSASRIHPGEAPGRARCPAQGFRFDRVRFATVVVRGSAACLPG